MKTRNVVLMGSSALLLSLLVSAPSRADEKGNTLLKQAFRTVHAAKSMTATLTVSRKFEGRDEPLVLKGSVAAMKPNFLKVELKGSVPNSEKPLTIMFVADGKDYYQYVSSRPEPNVTKLEKEPTEFAGEWEAIIDSFYGGEKNAEKIKADYSGTEKVGETDCEVVKAHVPANGMVPERTITYYIGKTDHLIYREAFALPESPEAPASVQTDTLSAIKLNIEKKPEDFKFVRPGGDIKNVRLTRPARTKSRA